VAQIEIPIPDIVALRITPTDHEEQALLAINVYNPCDESIVQKLHEELKRVDTSQVAIIMAGDFNAHHPMWNPVEYLRHDEVANDIIDLAAELGLTLLIPPGMVTYPHASTAIDLVWGNQEAAERVIKCRIAEENDQGSDHLPIET